MNKSLWGSCALLSIAVSCVSDEKQKAHPPNFIVIIADDAAWDDFGAYGNHSVRTPNIDELAKKGLLFTNAFLTTSSCSPSRASILTGRYPHSTGAEELHMPLPMEQNLFPGELQKLGYYTALAGKYHLGDIRPEFDTIYGGAPSGSEYWIEALNNRPKEMPFFFWFAALDPHRNYESGIIANPHSPADVIVPPYLPDNEFTREDLALYYDEISRLDSNVGLIISELIHQGVFENTVVILMSDNGRPFPRDKTRLYDSGIKTPFIVQWPAKIKPGVCDALISAIDIAPTILSLAGAGIPPVIQGQSFVHLFDNPNTSFRVHVFAEHNWHDFQAHERAVRSANYLYIRNSFPELNASPPADAVRSITFQAMIKMHDEGTLPPHQQDCFIFPRAAEELYDVVADPYQMNNLVLNETYSGVLHEMRSTLDKWIDDYNDVVPMNPTPDRFHRRTGNRLEN